MLSSECGNWHCAAATTAPCMYGHLGSEVVIADIAEDSRAPRSTRCRDLACVSNRAAHAGVNVTSFAEASALGIAPFTSTFSALLLADGVEVMAINLDLVSQDIDALAASLSDSERARACRFVYERDRRRFIVARGRLRELLAERLG